MITPMRLLILLLAVSGCDESCLGGEAGCRVSSPCTGLRYSCGNDQLEIGMLTGHVPLAGPEALGANGDVMLGNDRVVAVVAGLGNSNYLDPGGGALLDLAPRG